jgi:hypothetical protein
MSRQVEAVAQLQVLAAKLTDDLGAAAAACLIAGVELALDAGVSPTTVLDIVMMGYRNRGLLVVIGPGELRSESPKRTEE